MFLYRNKLTAGGAVPSELGSSKDLLVFDVSANQISGQLPSEIGLWSNVAL
jgi:hypothetical protein